MIKKLPPLDARIPEWDHNNLIERNCPFCVERANVICIRPDGLKVRYCEKCKTFFIAPCPNDMNLQKFYENYDTNHRRDPKVNSKTLISSYQKMNPFSDLKICELSSVFSFNGSRVLDIGFGRANFLYNLKKLGAIPFGLELDQNAIDFARILGIENVYKNDILNFKSENKFDLISMIDLIEHALNPFPLLQKSFELLRPGGIILIWTPSGDVGSIEKNPITFRVDLEHMQYLTPDTCLFIASQLKMRIIHLETLGFPSIKKIGNPISKNNSHINHIKGIIRSIPGFSFVNNLLHSKKDVRSGSYNLFCIMQKNF